MRMGMGVWCQSFSAKSMAQETCCGNELISTKSFMTFGITISKQCQFVSAKPVIYVSIEHTGLHSLFVCVTNQVLYIAGASA